MCYFLKLFIFTFLFDVYVNNNHKEYKYSQGYTFNSKLTKTTPSQVYFKDFVYRCRTSFLKSEQVLHRSFPRI